VDKYRKINHFYESLSLSFLFDFAHKTFAITLLLIQRKMLFFLIKSSKLHYCIYF